jgi:effector-binding domain-containing protein/uncharacterized protein YxeA
MKKWLFIIIAILVIFIAAVYLLIPQEATLTINTQIHANENGVIRLLQDTGHWRKWWNYNTNAGYTNTDSSEFIADNIHFTITEPLYKGLKLLLTSGNEVYNAQVNVIPNNIDSCYLLWQVKVPTGNNPFLKIIRYRTALGLKPAIQNVMNRFKPFAEDKANVYGVPLRQQGYSDTYLVATKTILTQPPTEKNIYALIQQLTAFAQQKKVYIPNGHPIYNITHWDKDSIQLMVSIPITQPINDEGKFAFKQMVKGNFIVTEVKGGPYTIDKAYKRLMQYFSDYHRTAMAIPFYRIMNNNPTATDTAQWVTEIYQPVF